MQDARDAYAVAQAGSDPLLTTVLRTNLWYTRGACHEPVVRDGVAFYVVGRNASHEFSLGVRDGQRYVRSYCGMEELEEEHIRAVPTWAGCYLGHA